MGKAEDIRKAMELRDKLRDCASKGKDARPVGSTHIDKLRDASPKFKKAWSDAAREASAEARRTGAKGKEPKNSTEYLQGLDDQGLSDEYDRAQQDIDNAENSGDEEMGNDHLDEVNREYDRRELKSKTSPGKPKRSVVAGPGGEIQRNAGPHAILPSGKINMATGKNGYWDDGTNEVWRDPDGKHFVAHTSGDEPLHGIGSTAKFKHDQTGAPMRGMGQSTMVGWFHTNPAGKHGGEYPMSGSLPVATYK